MGARIYPGSSIPRRSDERGTFASSERHYVIRRQFAYKYCMRRCSSAFAEAEAAGTVPENPRKSDWRKSEPDRERDK